MIESGECDFEMPERPPSGRVWLCNGCGHSGVWTDEWCWFGSLRELEDGDELPTFCSAACRPAASDLALIRQRIRDDPQFVLSAKTEGKAP